MTNPGFSLRLAMALCAAVSFAPSAISSGTGSTLFGNPFPIPGSGGNNVRQIVRLERVGDLLVGRPRIGALVMITAYAPDCQPANIVIRERAPENNSTLLHIVAPACLEQNLVQATLFLRYGATRARLAKSGADGWTECRLQNISLPNPTATGHSGPLLPAVVVNSLGFVQLSQGQFGNYEMAHWRMMWTASGVERMSRAAWHLFWPTATLMVFALFSWMVHKNTNVKSGD